MLTIRKSTFYKMLGVIDCPCTIFKSCNHVFVCILKNKAIFPDFEHSNTLYDRII